MYDKLNNQTTLGIVAPSWACMQAVRNAVQGVYGKSVSGVTASGKDTEFRYELHIKGKLSKVQFVEIKAFVAGVLWQFRVG